MTQCSDILNSQYAATGVLGLIVSAPLVGLAIWRLVALQSFLRVMGDGFAQKNKRIAFHVLILLSVLSDIPLYLGFVARCGYLTVPYAFHKLSGPLIFSALCLAINDWTAVLHDSHTAPEPPLFLRPQSLIAFNVMFVSISLVDVVYIVVAGSVENFANTVYYIIGYWLQIAFFLILLGLMLHAGMKLSMRLQNVAAGSASSPFQQAVNRLNLVMTVSLLCVGLQVACLVANYAERKERDPDATGMPWFAWWVAAVWIPEIGWVTSLLYLVRSSVNKTAMESDESGVEDQYRALTHDEHIVNPQSA